MEHDSQTVRQPGEKVDDALARLLGERVGYAETQAAIIEQEAKTYEKFVFGMPPSGGAEEDEDNVGKGWNLATVPLHGILRQVLLPSLLSRNPTWVNRSRRAADELEAARGKLMEELARVIYRESDAHRETACAIDDAMLRRVGWLHVDFDQSKKLPRIRWIDASRVRVDCENAPSPFVRDQRWWGFYQTMPISEAEHLAKTEWGLKGKHEFTPLKTDADKDPMALVEDSFPFTGRVQDRPKPTDYCRLLFVYVKGASPHGGTPNNDARPGAKVQEVGEDAVYSGKDELLILEAVSVPDENGTGVGQEFKFVGRKNWPFPCDAGECPATPLKITQDNRSFFPSSIFQASHSLQVAANWAMRFFNTDLKNSSRRFALYEDGKVSDKEMRAILFGPDNLVAVKVKGRADLSKIVSTHTFGEPNRALDRGIPANIDQWREVSGIKAFDLEARSHRTATDAALQNEGAQIRIGFMADQVEHALTTVMRKALQCALWNMTAEDVARWVGDDMMLFTLVETTTTAEDPVTGEETQVATGEGVRVSPLWDDESKAPAEIRDEVGIMVEPHSVRFVNPDTEVQDIQMLMQRQLELMDRIKDPEMPVEQKLLLARAGNGMIRVMADRLHIPSPENILIDLEMLAQVPPPPPEMPEMGGAGGPAGLGPAPQDPTAAGAVPPQTLGAIDNIAAQLGLDPSNLPPDIQQAIAQMGM